MGWLDKTLKNVARGARDFAKGPGGIIALSAAAPWLAPKLGPWAAKMAGSEKFFGSGKLLSSALKSPWIKNALTNAAMQGGIASLTGSKHPWKAMGYSALASMPFTALKSMQAAKAYNALAPKDGKVNWWDFALNTQDDAGESIVKDYLTTSVTPDMSAKEIADFVPKSIPAPAIEGYFTRNPSPLLDQVAGGKGLGSMIPALGLENMDLLATITPQIAGMYGGRMTEEEKWVAAKEKQIRQWAFQFGIPYEEAKEIWKDGYRNPYYQTQTPEDYGDIMFANKGGHIYKDDYTAGGKAVGPGGPKDDAIRPVALSDDEFVFTAEASNNFPGGHEGLYAVMNALDPESERPEEARERIV